MFDTENKESKYKIRLYINSIILNSIFLIWFAYFLLSYLVPWFKEVENKKLELKQIISNYKEIQKKWLSFDDVISNVKDEDFKKFITNDFFSSNFVNNWYDDYLKFLEAKEKYINRIKMSDSIKKRDDMIFKILPSYSKWIFVDWNMVDLEFINYVETILKTFSLKTNSSIWIKEVIPINNKSNKSTQTEIFYIPLSLNLEWKKWDLLDFLYFAEKVWFVNDVTNEKIDIYSDKYFNKNLFWKNQKQNIYENKIFDIEKIKIPEHIDTSSIPRQDLTKKGFIDFIKNTYLKDEDISVNVDLRFFVKWLPTYKISDFIKNDIILVYDKISKKTESLIQQLETQKLKDNSKQIVIVLNKLKNIDLYLKDKQKDIQQLKLFINQNRNLEDLYLKNKDLRNTLNEIKIYIDSIKIIKSNKK